MHPLPSEGAIGEREQDNHCPGPLADRNLQEYEGCGTKDARNIFRSIPSINCQTGSLNFQKAIPETSVHNNFDSLNHNSTVNTARFRQSHSPGAHKLLRQLTFKITWKTETTQAESFAKKRGAPSLSQKESSEQRPPIHLDGVSCFGNCLLQADHRIPLRPPRLRFPLTLRTW